MQHLCDSRIELRTEMGHELWRAEIPADLQAEKSLLAERKDNAFETNSASGRWVKRFLKQSAEYLDLEYAYPG